MILKIRIDFGHHSFGTLVVYVLVQSEICNCRDLHQARCILSTSIGRCPFAAKYGLIVSFITGMKAMMSRSGTCPVDCTPSI